MSHFYWNDFKINLFDTPGSSGFIGEVVEAFRASESAIMVIDGKNSVQIETIKLWRRLNEREMPRAVFVNRMDIDRANFQHVMDDLKSKFKKTCVPLTLPIGSGASFKGIVNLIEMKAYLVHDPLKKDIPSEIPPELMEEVKTMREAMIENAAEGDDSLIEKYFNEGTLSEENIIKGLTLGMRNNRVVPVLAGSSTLNNGVASLLNFICTAAPSPKDVHEIAVNKEGEERDLHADSAAPFSAFAFKTKYDQFAGKLSFVKVITGKLTSDIEVKISNTDQKEKVHKLFSLQGAKLDEIDALESGDIGVITKMQPLQTNETITLASLTYHFKSLKLPQPIHSLAIWTDSKKDADKMNDALHRAAEEDHTFTIQFNAETKETVIAGMGELHINMILNRIMEKQKIKIHSKTPRVAYRESITKSTNAEYTHKKQSGGHGQYGKVLIKIDPIKDQKYDFINAIKGGSISKGYIPGIEKGFHEGMAEGYLAGYPLTGIRFTLIDGKEHPVDSSEMAFKLAAKGALKEGMEKAGATLLEPIMMLKVFSEEKYMGDILSDISSKRGRVIGQENLGGGINEIDAEVPQSELLRYAIDLKSMTSGTGSFEIEFAHYNSVTGKLAQQIIDESKKAKEKELH